MGYLSPTITPGSEFPESGSPAPGLPFPENALVSLTPPEQVLRQSQPDLISNLRQSLSAGTRSPAAILHASTDAARALTGADGAAIAVRTKGVVVCRARSGDLAPELGSLVNTDSGFSGECLRSATILLCDDTTTDDRVDPEVCRTLGIRSIVAVPLRGPAGIAGILEAFSSNPSAFGHLHIDALRELAEIAEVAYDRECRAHDAAPHSLKSATRRQLFSALAARNQKVRGETLVGKSVAGKSVAAESLGGEIFGEPSRQRRYWIWAIAALALLLISAVVWLSWRDPTPDLTASEPEAKSVNAAASSTAAAPIRTEPKPEAGILTRKPSSLKTTGLLRNAAEIDPDAGPPNVSTSEVRLEPKITSDTGNSASDAPPSVEISASSSQPLLTGLASESATLPTLEAKISQGITRGALVHEVPAIYPPQARMQRLSGAVVVDATIGKDGVVRSVKLISGPTLLAGAATDAVRQWRYSPSLLNGTPIEVQKRITVVFKLP